MLSLPTWPKWLVQPDALCPTLSHEVSIGSWFNEFPRRKSNGRTVSHKKSDARRPPNAKLIPLPQLLARDEVSNPTLELTAMRCHDVSLDCVLVVDDWVTLEGR
jgi:hypothetical protein